jgi:hypothetical protein
MKVLASNWMGFLLAWIAFGSGLTHAAETNQPTVLDSKALARRVAERNIFDPDRQPRTRGESRPIPKPVVAVAADASSADGIAALLGTARQEFGGVDIYVANAGIVGQPGLGDDEAAWDQIIDVNVRAHIRAAKAVMPEWLERGSGHFVVVSSLLLSVVACTAEAGPHATGTARNTRPPRARLRGHRRTVRRSVWHVGPRGVHDVLVGWGHHRWNLVGRDRRTVRISRRQLRGDLAHEPPRSDRRRTPGRSGESPPLSRA